MDAPDRVRLREDQKVVVAAHLAVPGIEAGAAIALLVELELLDHGAHGTVEHQDALARDATERLLGGRGLGRHFRHSIAHAATSIALSALAFPPPLRGRDRERGPCGESE